MTSNMTGKRHVSFERNTARCGKLAKRSKNPVAPFKVVIVRDMWLTSFDAPCLHTMYADKPIRGHRTQKTQKGTGPNGTATCVA